MTSRSTSGGSRPPAVRRLAALDGIRGVLVIFLLCFHFGFTQLQGAWLTLNVFFVLSGFLIVRLLVQERARSGRIRFVAFYARRARRLFPALALLLVTLMIYGFVFASSQVRGPLRWDVLATMGYFMNWRLIAQSNQYFAQFTEPSMLQHAWSLSVEEQFYLVVPLLVLGLMAVLRTRWSLIAALAGLAVLSAVWMALVGVGSDIARSHLYYGTDTRAQSLLIGAALGVWTARWGAAERPNPFSVRQVQFAGIGAFVVTVLGFVVAVPQTPLMADGGMFALSLVAVAWVWAASDERGGPLQRLLAVPPLAALGRISYGAYLWHWPIGLWLAQLMPDTPTWVHVVLGFVLTIGVATVSYQRIEQPIHDRGWRAVVGGVLQARALAAGVAAVLVAGAVGLGVGAPAAAGQARPRKAARVIKLIPGQATFEKPAKPYTIALYGDSVPDLLVQNFPKQNFPGITPKAIAVPGCDLLDQPYVNPAQKTVSPNHTDCKQFKAQGKSRINDAHSQLLVIFPSILLAFPHRFGGHDLWWGDPGYTTAVAAGLDRVVAEAKSSGSQPAIVTQTCRDSATGLLQHIVDVAGAKDPALVAEMRTASHVNAFLRSWAAKRDIPVADLDRALCPAGTPRVLPGIPVYGDEVHLSAQITPSVWAFLIAELASYRDGAT